MDAAAQVTRAEPAEVHPYFRACLADLRQGKRLADVTAGTACFLLDIGGRKVFAWAVKQIGTECWIAAAAGRAPGVDLTATGFGIIEAQAAGLETVAFQTRRRGLVRRAQRLGYQIDGYILRKRLK